MDILIYGMIFFTVMLVASALGMAVTGRDAAAKRIRASAGVDAPVQQQSLRLRRENARLDRLLEPFQERIRAQEAADKTVVERPDTLKAAGYYSPRAGSILYAIRFSLAVVVSTAAASVLFLTGRELSPLITTLIVVGAGAVAFYIPLVYVSSRAKERKLQFSEGLPDTLDLMLICLEAGLTFPAAMQYIAREFRDVHKVIAENFAIVNLEFRAGRQRSEALKNLARRVDLVELTSIVNMINQSESLGTSLTRAIRTAAFDIRRERMLRAEEKANALPAKMSLVLTACVFPTLFLIILVPILLRFLEAF